VHAELRGLLLAQRGACEAALAAFDEVPRAEWTPEVTALAALCRLRLGDYDEAIAGFDAALALLPGDKDILARRADAVRMRELRMLGPDNPSPMNVIEAALRLAEVKPGELVLDPACGEGRALLCAARNFGARAIGFELDAALVARARANTAGLPVELHCANTLDAELPAADVVYLYLPLRGVAALEQRVLAALQPGGRVVTHDHPMLSVEPVAERHLHAPEKSATVGYPAAVVRLYRP